MKLFTAIYNDARLLANFLAHYKAAEITEFFIAVHPTLKSAVSPFASNYRLTVIDDLDVTDTPMGGVSAVAQMRDRYQQPSEWVVIVDLDEFIEFPCPIGEIVEEAERDHANVVRGIMWDRFSSDGSLIDFEPGCDIARVFPVRARFIHEIMGGADYKGVLVKGMLASAVAHHIFAGEIVHSRYLDISHYKWFAGALDRVESARRRLLESGQEWAVEYQRVLDHYSRHGRFAWEEFGGEWISRPAVSRSNDLSQRDLPAQSAVRPNRVALQRPSSRVHLYAQCWNDAFMLPFFFKHYDSFVDRYVIYDDGSTDTSLQILTEHPRVEVRRFARSCPDSFVLSEQALSNSCWKESRGEADWVIVTDVDEHLYHAAMHEYLQSCIETGVTAIPALGFQMIGDEPTQLDDQLCKSRVLGAPSAQMMKLSIFDPDRIEEINFAEGRHRAEPVGKVVVPNRDEVLLLHYKYLGIERTFRRQQQLRLGLGSGDVTRKWGIEYFWSEAELGKDWKTVAAEAGDVRQMRADIYPIEPWWSRWPRAPESYPASPALGPLSRAAFEAAIAAHWSEVASAVAAIDAAITSGGRKNYRNDSS